MSVTTSSKSLKRLSLLSSTSLVASSLPSPDIASTKRADRRDGLASPVSSSSSPTVNSHAVSRSKSGRRHSSIYYVPSDRDVEWTTKDLGSPVNTRRFSALQGSAESASSMGKREKGSVDLTDATPPLSLAERHADLLRFIAQKEAKCLELRSQLATNEAELLTLKCKWERIVSRGFSIGSSTSVSSVDADASAQGAVFTGLREGVQGVGRLLAHLGELGAQGSDANMFANAESGHASNSSVSTTLTSSSSMRLSQSSMSSLGVPDDELPEERKEVSLDSEVARRRPHSISTAVRRKSYELSPPPTPSPPLMAPKSLSTISSCKSIPPSSSKSHRVHSTPPPTQSKNQKRLSATSGTFPFASSIPGVSAGVPLASWVDSVVGKRLSGTGSAQLIHKRASTLLSDASHSLFAALASSTRSSSSQANDPSPSPSPSGKSLLDDDTLGEWTGMTALSPDKATPIHAVPSGAIASGPLAKRQEVSAKDSEADREEWNW